MTELLTKREHARVILCQMFAENKRISIPSATEAGRDAGVSYSTMRRARIDLGAVEVRNGPYPGFWEMPEGEDQ